MSDHPFGRDDELWTALARYQAGESPPEEREALRLHLAAHPERAALVRALDGALREAAVPPRVDAEAALASVRARRDGAARSPGRRPWTGTALRFAAGLVLAIGAGTLWRALRPEEPVRYATGIGETESVRLPDGSTVRLGPGTRLVVREYARRRVLELDGEAFFKVQHDESPFLVHTPGALVRDLGTAFTLRSGKAGTRVGVTEGSVAVAARRGGGETVLRVGDRAEVDASGRVRLERGAAMPEDTAWTQGRLVFRDAPLSEVAEQMARWYGIALVLPEGPLADRRVTATLDGRSAEEALAVIGALLGARIERRGDTAAIVSPARP